MPQELKLEERLKPVFAPKTGKGVEAKVADVPPIAAKQKSYMDTFFEAFLGYTKKAKDTFKNLYTPVVNAYRAKKKQLKGYISQALKRRTKVRQTFGRDYHFNSKKAASDVNFLGRIMYRIRKKYTQKNRGELPRFGNHKPYFFGDIYGRNSSGSNPYLSLYESQ